LRVAINDLQKETSFGWAKLCCEGPIVTDGSIPNTKRNTTETIVSVTDTIVFVTNTIVNMMKNFTPAAWMMLRVGLFQLVFR
jgi:hypothetical protein